MNNAVKQNAAAFVSAACCGCIVAVVLIVLIIEAALSWPRAALCIGTLLAALGLWVAAWECGRRFERDHGRRACGAKPDGF